MTKESATRAAVRAPLAPEAGGAGLAGAAKPVILVVEDDPRVLRAITAALGARFQVETAADGAQGLAAALALVPDLIVTDLMMPRMTGEELVREVRSRPELAGIPIVLLTGVSDEEMRVRVLRDGALDYITKPFSTRELLSRVENFVRLKLARDLLERELDCRDRDLDAMTRELVARKRQLEATLEVAQHERDKAARASEAKSDLLRLVSHELRTPVAALRLIAQQMERDRRVPIAPEHLHRLRRILSVSDRLSAQIDALLEHVRLEGGGGAVRADAVDVPVLVAEVLDPLVPQVEEKGLELRVTADPGLPTVQSNRRMLRLILANLAGNAVKFTDAGSVTVSIRRVDGTCRVAVTDTGPGIAPADQSRMFEPFEQLAPLDHKHKPGLGLGLALAREAATALGARIEVDSGEGRGSTFTLVLSERGDVGDVGAAPVDPAAPAPTSGTSGR